MNILKIVDYNEEMIGEKMKNWQQVVQQKTFRLLDQTNTNTFEDRPYTALTSFAIDDALALSVSGGESPPVLRMWVHPKTVVLGIPDTRLPYIEEGVKFLADEGYNVIVRNSGGLAVALDKGVLNVSLILPNVRHLSIDEGYEAMYHFTQHMLRNVTSSIQAYEIIGSYCPGDYDLSIDGIKFAGISQRRVRDGTAIQIYLDVEGDSLARASLIRSFYERSIKGEETNFEYPDVQPHVMGSLTRLTQTNMTVPQLKNRVKQTIEALSTETISYPFTPYELEQFYKRYDQMIKRNEHIHAFQDDQ